MCSGNGQCEGPKLPATLMGGSTSPGVAQKTGRHTNDISRSKWAASGLRLVCNPGAEFLLRPLYASEASAVVTHRCASSAATACICVLGEERAKVRSHA